MWHASVSPTTGRLNVQAAHHFARQALSGVGDLNHEWLEITNVAVHVRRRLTPSEQLATGPVVDVRGTPEAEARFAAAIDQLGDVGRQLALVEMRQQQR